MSGEVLASIAIGVMVFAGTGLTVVFGRKSTKETNLGTIFQGISDERQKYIDQLQEDRNFYREELVKVNEALEEVKRENGQYKTLVRTLKADKITLEHHVASLERTIEELKRNGTG